MLVVMAAKCAGWSARTGRKFFLTSCAPETAGGVCWVQATPGHTGLQHSDTRRAPVRGPHLCRVARGKISPKVMFYEPSQIFFPLSNIHVYPDT